MKTNRDESIRILNNFMNLKRFSRNNTNFLPSGIRYYGLIEKAEGLIISANSREFRINLN